MFKIHFELPNGDGVGKLPKVYFNHNEAIDDCQRLLDGGYLASIEDYHYKVWYGAVHLVQG